MSSPPKNRRKKPDPLIKLMIIANVGAAAALLTALCLTALAKPERATFFDHFYSTNRYLRLSWDMNLMNYIGIMLLTSLLLSLAGLYCNSKRLNRKGDFVRATQVVSLIIAIFGLGFYLKFMLTYAW